MFRVEVAPQPVSGILDQRQGGKKEKRGSHPSRQQSNAPFSRIIELFLCVRLLVFSQNVCVPVRRALSRNEALGESNSISASAEIPSATGAPLSRAITTESKEKKLKLRR